MSNAVFGFIGALVGGLAAMGGAGLQAHSATKTALARLDVEEQKTRREHDQAAAERRQALARRYLFGLQDSAESLRRRLQNWADRGGKRRADASDPGYWDITTLYAVARALAAERILALEAVYPALEADFPSLVQFYRTDGVDSALSNALGAKLFRYHRLALAEAALQREADEFRVLIFSEFRRRYEAPEWGLERLLGPATSALAGLTEPQMRHLERRLDQIVAQLESVTSVPRIDEARSVDI